MNLSDAIQGRRSVRKYTDNLVDENVIRKIIEAGTFAPSACNVQGWKFIVINDEGAIATLVKAGTAHFVKDVKQCMLVLYDNQTDNLEYNDYIESASAAIQNMLLTAFSLNVGTCWVNNLPSKAKLRRLFQIPNTYDPIALITFGYYDKQLNQVPRKSEISDVIAYNSFTFDRSNVVQKNKFLLNCKRFCRKIYMVLPGKKYLYKIVGKAEKKFDN